ncbi:MAG: NUDIX domain-containing protein [Candidatus Daviesbacteria bacterium]|nr:NUDIX domain-containing protein [Candidatus Daviesbacteria bacterium]
MKRTKKIDQSWYQKIPGTPETQSAGGVVVRNDRNTTYLALIKEGDYYDDYVLPKGHLDPGETIEQAATREIEEETGLSEIKLITKLGVLERLSYRKDEWKITHYFLFATNQLEGTPTDSNRNYSKTEWFPLDNLPKLHWPEQKKLLEDNLDKIKRLVLKNEK